MQQNNELFSYTYSSKQREEVDRIRKKYLPPEQNPLEQLRRLDESADRPGKLAALISGVLGTLLFGIGMCYATVWTDYFAPGIVVGVIGLAGVCAAYPLYAAVTKRRRIKLAPEIMRLSAELTGGE